MSTQIAMEFPEDVFSALREDPEGFAKKLRLAAAVKWYELGEVSQERAAKIAGLSRKEFIEALYNFKVSPVQYEVKEIEEELASE